MSDAIEAGAIVSVNIGVVRPFETPARMRPSAIDKRPVDEPLFVGPLGVSGDQQAERRFHGGPRKAVYVYAAEDLDWWSTELDRPMPAGFIGENLTTRGLDVNGLRAGDELHVGAGDLILQVTQAREPCTKLAARLGLPNFVKRFGRAARTGVYCAVKRTGFVQRGDSVAILRAGAGPSIREIVRAQFGRD